MALTTAPASWSNWQVGLASGTLTAQMMMRGRFLWGRPFSVWRVWPEAARSVWNHMRCRDVAWAGHVRARGGRGDLRADLASAMPPSRQV